MHLLDCLLLYGVTVLIVLEFQYSKALAHHLPLLQRFSSLARFLYSFYLLLILHSTIVVDS
jgi:hypothetical protein